jgi:hypothetical protein
MPEGFAQDGVLVIEELSGGSVGAECSLSRRGEDGGVACERR